VSEVAATGVPERRRYPRHVVRACTARVQSPLAVEIIDLSLTGCLIRCECPLRVGDHAELQTVFAHRPFVASVRVVRSTDEHSREKMSAFGVKFVAAGENSAAALRAFLDEGGNR
jgi:hypothetical protein